MVDSNIQINAVKGLISRVLGAQMVDHFVLATIPAEDGLDVFELETRNGKVILSGSSGVAICSALNHYLHHFCKSSCSIFGNNIALPETLPSVNVKIRKTSSVKFRYIFNNCTFGYSMPWWDWHEWEKVIDWMALNGYNFPLAMTGHECVWRNVYQRMGFSDVELLDFFPGPAYFPWWVMGNLDGWGGPLPLSWFEKHVELQRKILARERELGMIPVLQAFSGHIPSAVQKRYPDANIVRLEPWVFKENFKGSYFLYPTDPLFKEIGKIFIEEQEKLFGTDHYYAADNFNEMTPPNNDPQFLSDTSKAVFEAMAGADPEAVWMMMGWIVADGYNGFWQKEQVEGLFNGVPDGRLILLDFTNDWESPTWKACDSFLGKPYIANVIMNFGGKVGLGNPMSVMFKNYQDAFHSNDAGRVWGIGIVPEGFDPNPIVYDYVSAMNWDREVPDPDDFAVEFCKYRYGANLPEMEAAWIDLRKVAYGDIHWGGSNSILCLSPDVEMYVWEPPTPDFYNRLAHILRVFYAHKDQLQAVDTYRHDVVHILRDVLMVGMANHYYRRMINSFTFKSLVETERLGNRLLELIMDSDCLLGTRGEYLLGTWLEVAKSWGNHEYEKRLYEYNARMQLTVWGPLELPKRELNDYAAKQWSGLLRGYYYWRWKLFVEYLVDCLKSKMDFDSEKWMSTIHNYEMNWHKETDLYPTRPEGDSIQIAGQLMAKYSLLD